jgi:predicted dehydrogenase
MAHFVDCILHDRPHMATGEEGLVVMEILDAIYKSARLGKPVRVAAKK